MRSTSFLPLQAPVTEHSAHRHTTLLQHGLKSTSVPAWASTLSGVPLSSPRSMSTTHFLSARLSPSEQLGTPMNGVDEMTVSLDGEIPGRPKRRLPSGHLMRFSTSTATTPSLDDVLIEPVERWSDNVGAAGRPRIKPNVLLYRIRGAHPNAPVFSRRGTVSSGRTRFDVTEATNRRDGLSVAELPSRPAEERSPHLQVPFSPDLTGDGFAGRDGLRLCDRKGHWTELSFWQCHRNAFDVEPRMGEQATSPDPVVETSSHASQIVGGSVLLPASSPLWWLLSGTLPKWLSPISEVRGMEYVEPLPVPMPLAMRGDMKPDVVAKGGWVARQLTGKFKT